MAHCCHCSLVAVPRFGDEGYGRGVVVTNCDQLLAVVTVGAALLLQSARTFEALSCGFDKKDEHDG